MGENGELSFPNGETEFPDREINFPRLGENGGKLWGKEREFRFQYKFQFHSTVYMLLIY